MVQILDFPPNELEFGIPIHDKPEKRRYHEIMLTVVLKLHGTNPSKRVVLQPPLSLI